MILINGVEIRTIEDNFTFSGAKDIVTRSLDFNFIYNPLRKIGRLVRMEDWSWAKKPLL